MLEARAGDLVDELNRSLRDSWKPPETLTAPPPEKVYSRWRQGPRSFGPAVKLPLTALSILFVMLALMTLGKPWKDLEAFVSYPVVLVPIGMFLRALWRRERIR